MLRVFVPIVLLVTLVGCAIPFKSEDLKRFDNMRASMDSVGNNIKHMTKAAQALGEQIAFLNLQIGSIDILNSRLLELNENVVKLTKELTSLQKLGANTTLLANRIKSLQEELAKLKELFAPYSEGG